MKPTDKIDFLDVGALIRQLGAQKTTRSRFNIELPVEQVANGIYASICAELNIRGHTIDLTEEMKRYILEAARWLTDENEKPGLMLKGLYGNGKTTMMRGIGRLIEYVTEQTLGYGGRSVVRFIMAKEIAEFFTTEEGKKDFKKILNLPMLAIDDLGEEPKEVISYGMVYTPMIDLLSYRYDRQLFTLLTTNLTSQEIEAKYTKRIRDRFREMMHTIHFKNDSFRK